MEAATVQNLDSGIQITEQRANGRIVWSITKGESSMRTEAATVMARLPALSNYHGEPITDGDITVKLSRYNAYGQGLERIKPDLALGIASALKSAAEKIKEEYEKLRPQVADLLAKREEEKKKREEHHKLVTETREKIATLRSEWGTKMKEALAWYEGQPGRLKRVGKKGWDNFDELGAVAVSSYGGGNIYWVWSNQRFSDGIEQLDKIEIKYPGERTYDPVEDLPKFPKKEIDKLQEKLRSF